MRAAAVAILLLTTLCAGRAGAQVPGCLSLPPVEDVAPGDMPAPLRSALARDVGPYALPGQDFDATDVVRTGVRRRLLWVRRRGTRWVVAFERGGRNQDDPVVAYELGLDGVSIAGVRAEIAFPATVCQMTERELWR